MVTYLVNPIYYCQNILDQTKQIKDVSSVCKFKNQPYLGPSSGISIVWRADSWRRRHATPQLSALQTMEMPLDGTNMADS